jgi:hypothetical protein
MNGGDIVKWGVIGLAGWWVYENFFANAAASAYTVATLPTGASQPANGTILTVADGQNATDCTAGGGKSTVACESVWIGPTPNGYVSQLALQAKQAGFVQQSPIQIPVPAPIAVAALPPVTTAAAPAASSASATQASSQYRRVRQPAASSTLDTLYNAMVAKAQAANDPAITNSGGVLSATGYVWQYYLQAVNPSVTAAMESASNGNTVYTSAQFWTLVSPAIGAALGLSGLRGGLAGLGRAVMGGRR